MFTGEELLESVNQYIENLSFDRKPSSLYEPIKYSLAMGGKRIRPILMMLVYQLYKDDPTTILSSACALETYHNYTLLHDDLMDNALLRRGHETVHKKWNANAAILSGDSMLVYAYHLLSECNHPRFKEILNLFTVTALEIGEGQQYDIEFELRSDVTENEYIEMIRLKTSVLIACAMKIGAMLAGASNEDAHNLYLFGECIGLAFQLQDDYLDVYGDSKVFGKSIGGDIVSNKKTFMLINALNKADNVQKKELQYWLKENTKEHEKEKIKAVTSIYNSIGVDKLALDKINAYFEESKQYLANIDLPNERKEELMTYVSAMMKRNH